MRRPQTSFPTGRPSHTIVCVGDSITDSFGGNGPNTSQMYPARIANRLNGIIGSSKVQCRNYGIAGQRSANMVNRADICTLWETPDAVIMWGGTNDCQGGGAVTWSATGGTITGTTGQYLGIVLVFHSSVGIAQVTQAMALATTTTTTGSFVFPSIGSALYETSYDVYVTNATYPTAVAAIQAATSTYAKSASSAAASGGSITSTTVTSVGNTTYLNSVAGVSAFTSQQCYQAFARAIKYRATGLSPYVLPTQGVAVASQTNLPAGNYQGCRLVVMNDTSTTGGAAATQSDQHATITGIQAGITVWERRYQLAGEAGWGRVATGATAPFNTTTKIFILGQHYLNYSTFGDTQSAAYQPFDAVSGIRSQQIAAAAAEAALDSAQTAYIDLYSYLSNRIANGSDTQGSHSWHAADSNVHLNSYGEDLVAIACVQAVQNTSGLIAQLSS